MSVAICEQFTEQLEVTSFEDIQRGLGMLSLKDRDLLDRKAREIFSEEAKAYVEFGPASPQAQACDERVLWYSCLESQPAIYDRDIPQRVA